MVDATIEGRELDSESSVITVADAVPSTEPVRLRIVAPLILTTNFSEGGSYGPTSPSGTHVD